MAMFKVTLTIQDLDAATPQEAAQMFRDCMVDGFPLQCVVEDGAGSQVSLPLPELSEDDSAYDDQGNLRPGDHEVRSP